MGRDWAGEWDAATRFDAMLMLVFPKNRSLQQPGATRKVQLLACAAARSIWSEIPDDRLRDAVVVTERFALGLTTAGEILRYKHAANAAWAQCLRKRLSAKSKAYNSGWPSPRDADEEAFILASRAVSAAEVAHLAYAGASSISELVDALRGVELLAEHVMSQILFDIFGQPFRPLRFNKRWRTSIVLGLADGIAADGAFDRLPVLADALEEAGCDDAELLAHCRGPGPHVRGCWAVDVVRGKHWQPRRK